MGGDTAICIPRLGIERVQFYDCSTHAGADTGAHAGNLSCPDRDDAQVGKIAPADIDIAFAT